MIGVVGMVAALGMGVTACGAPSGFNGQGTVIGKEIDKEKKTKKVTGTNKKKTTTTTEYEVTVDVDNSEEHQEFDVTQAKYDALREGQKVTIQNGRIL